MTAFWGRPIFFGPSFRPKTGVRVDFLSCRRRVAPMAGGSTVCVIGWRSRRLRWGVAILAVGNAALSAWFQAALPVDVWGAPRLKVDQVASL